MNPMLYVWREEREQGPFMLAQLRVEVGTGELSDAALVRDAAGGDWGPLNQWIARAEAADRQEAAQRRPPPIPAPRIRRPDERGQGMESTGIVVGLVGLAVGAAAVLMNSAPDGIHNLGLLMDRLCLVLVAAALFLAGCLFFCAGWIVSQLPERRPRD